MATWMSQTDDPNSAQAHSFRNVQLAEAHRPVHPSRLDFIVSCAAGKRVLDIGCVNHRTNAFSDADWLHGKIAKAAGYCLGVDVQQEGVKRLQAEGYNVKLCDITSQPVGEKFDLMICGEVIEHLGNPGQLFCAAKDCLIKGGTFVLTTPNPYYLNRAVQNLKGRCYDSVDHVSLLFPSGMAEFADRAGFKLKSYFGVEVAAHPRTLLGKAAFLFRKPLELFLAPEAFCETMVYVLALCPDNGPPI